jgi:O-antigen ligase
MITELPFAIRFGLLVVLAVLTLRYSAQGVQNGVLLFLGVSLFPFDQAILWREGGLPILTMDRVVWPLVVVSFVMQRMKGKIKVRRLDAIERCMIVFLAIIVGSMYVHETFIKARWYGETFNFYEVLAGFALPFLCYFIIRRGVSTEAQFKAFLTGVGVITLYLGITGLGEALNQSWLVYPKYILDYEIGIFGGSGRVRGPFVQSSWNGLAMVMGLPILFWLLSSRSGTKRWLWLVGIAGVMVSIPYSFQRAVWLGAAAALGLTSLAWPKRGPMIAAAVLLIGTLGALLMPDNLSNSLARRKNDSESIEYRMVMLETAKEIISDHLLVGVGFSRFEEALLQYGLDKTFVSHSFLLSLGAELGLLGFLPYLLILSLLLLRSVKIYLKQRRLRPLIAGMWGITLAYLIMAMAVEMRQVLYPNVLLFSLWAILLASVRQRTLLRKNSSAAYRRVVGWQPSRFHEPPIVVPEVDSVRSQLGPVWRSQGIT